MDVAISGDRSCCLTQELPGGAFLFAVAHGFGRIDGEPVAPAVLARLRSDFDRRAAGGALHRAQSHPKGLTKTLTGAFQRVNEYAHSRSASHEDYITAGCSLTAALVLGDRAYLSHVGSTAAYLARDGYIVSLTKHDAFDGRLPILTRAVGVAPEIESTVCTFSLSEGDSLVLAGRRLSQEEIKAGASGEQMLVVRYAPPVSAPAPAQPPISQHRARAVVTGVLATVFFYLLLCIN